MDEKAEGLRYFSLERNQEEFRNANRDMTGEELHWSDKLLKGTEPIFPSTLFFHNVLDYLEEPHKLDDMPEG